MTILSELSEIDLTEDRMRRFEAIHEAIRDAEGSLTGALVLLRTRAADKVHPAHGVAWDLAALIRNLESREYAMWTRAFGAVMAQHTLWSGFTALSDPDKIPKAVASNVLRMAGTQPPAEKPRLHPAQSAAQDLKKDMLG